MVKWLTVKTSVTHSDQTITFHREFKDPMKPLKVLRSALWGHATSGLLGQAMLC